MKRRKLERTKHTIKALLFLFIILSLLGGGVILLWMSTFKMPDLSSFEERKVVESTKIYDRTGEILLYDVHENIKRSVVPYTEIGKDVKNATVAIEDGDFWQHKGVKPLSFLRAVFINLQEGRLSQGGSTITQQVIKNSLLTSDKKISRKLKEWVLAYRLEKILNKEEILAIYLNESPFGGSVYGIQEASKTFFKKNANELTLAESAYLAAIPNAPTYFSPYGNNRDKLEERKNLVLQRMLEKGFITQEDYNKAKEEKVVFGEQRDTGIKAPHFVFYIIQQLEEKYGKEAVEREGFRVTTTLDMDLQEKGQKMVSDFIEANGERFDASNASLVAIDPKTGQILTMVGSIDYFSDKIDGNFNVAIARRQPGSSFKPLAYATAFKKGLTPDTVVFDLETQFSSSCAPYFFDDKEECYSPKNYSGTFSGPVTLRNALARSLNIPAVKTLYIAGIKDTINTAKDFGITSLNDESRFGLALVLGGGEVSLLEMTGAYSVFANEGRKNPITGILKIEDKDRKTIEEFASKEKEVIDPNITYEISDILSDERARIPVFGVNTSNLMKVPGHSVAVKTGTTNDTRDAWVMGYSPNLAVGVWVGNNDNHPMKNAAGASMTPLWNNFAKTALATREPIPFKKPLEPSKDSKPVLRGIWRGGISYFTDAFSGGLATEYTPEELKVEKVLTSVHNILYWINKDDVSGQKPEHPEEDSQFSLWEYPVRLWASKNGYIDESTDVIPKNLDTAHSPDSIKELSFKSPTEGSSFSKDDKVTISLNYKGNYPILKYEIFVNGAYVGTSSSSPYSFSFIPQNIQTIKEENTLRIVLKDQVLNQREAIVNFRINPSSETE